MIATSLFFSRLMPWVTGCPEPIAKQALVDAAIEFCTETQITETISLPQAAAANVGLFTITVPAMEQVLVTQRAWWGTTELSPATDAAIDSILAYSATAGTTSQQTGTPSVFYEVSPGVVGVYPIPATSQANIFSAKATTKPLRSATSLEDVLYEDWADAIVLGARAYLHAMPGQFFSSDTKAAQSRTDFKYYINRAKGIAKRGRVQGSLRVTARPF